jgi:hypothetical protein
LQDEKTIKPRISLVAAVDSYGSMYAGIFLRNSNIITTKLMLYKLMQVQDEENPEWRQNTVLFLNGADYHNNTEIK